jgi:hypothetical protein
MSALAARIEASTYMAAVAVASWSAAIVCTYLFAH